MTSRSSTTTYTVEDLNQFLTLTECLKRNAGNNLDGATCTLGRLMFNFARTRFLHFHGQPAARLERSQSVHPTMKARKWSQSFFPFSLLLFFSPDVHLVTLDSTFVDGLMNDAVWGETITKLISEWREYALYAALLMNANGALLTIQSVDTSEKIRSAVQIATYLSTVASIGSISLSLILVRKNRAKVKDDALRFLNARRHRQRGLEKLAIMFSLPYALLMWGVLAFLVAFSLICIIKLNTLARLAIYASCLALVFVMFWSIWMAWEHPSVEEIEEEEQDQYREAETKLLHWTKQWWGLFNCR